MYTLFQQKPIIPLSVFAWIKCAYSLLILLCFDIQGAIMIVRHNNQILPCIKLCLQSYHIGKNAGSYRRGFIQA